MLTLAAQVLFLVALVRASEFPLQPRSGPCDSSGPDYSERVCGDICLPVGQFCCGNVPASSLLYACPIGTVCNDYFTNDSDYLARCCEGLYNPPIGAIASCQVVPPFPSTSYIPGTATAPTTAPSSTACGAEANAEGYGYRACGDICLDVEHICCGFILGTNQAWSCAVGQACLTSGSANIAPGSCVDASGYIVPGTTFVASNTTVASSPPSTTTTSMISSLTPTTTSSSGLTTSSTGGSTITRESASITAQSSSSSTTSQLPISTTSMVAAGSLSLGTVTSSPSPPAFTGAATRHGPIENGVIYVLGVLIVGAAAGDLGLF
jgi:hypothetical protein